METVIQCAIKNGGLDSFLLDFEKFVSEQEVNIPFFSQRNDFSKSFIPFSLRFFMLTVVVFVYLLTFH